MLIAAGLLFQRVGDDAQRYGFVSLELVDKLALAELANKTKHGAQFQMELHRLQNFARSRGFGLIARKAVLVQPNGSM